MKDLNTPIWQLTTGELLDLIKIEAKPIEIDTTTPDPINPKHYVYGLTGIAELLKCSKSTANRIKQSGIIKDAIKQMGKIIIVDAEKALELIANHQK